MSEVGIKSNPPFDYAKYLRRVAENYGMSREDALQNITWDEGGVRIRTTGSSREEGGVTPSMILEKSGLSPLEWEETMWCRFESPKGGEQ